MKKWLHQVELKSETFNYHSLLENRIISHKSYRFVLNTKRINLGFYYLENCHFVFDVYFYNHPNGSNIFCLELLKDVGLYKIMKERIYRYENKAKIQTDIP